MTFLRTSDLEPVDTDNALPVMVMDDVQSTNIVGTTKQVVVATSATLIADVNLARRSVLITQITGTQICYISFNNGVLSSNNHFLGATAGNNVTIYSKGQVWGIAASSAQTVSVLEEYVS